MAWLRQDDLVAEEVLDIIASRNSADKKAYSSVEELLADLKSGQVRTAWRLYTCLKDGHGGLDHCKRFNVCASVQAWAATKNQWARVRMKSADPTGLSAALIAAAAK